MAVGPVGRALAAVVGQQGEPVGAGRRAQGEVGELLVVDAEQGGLQVEDPRGVHRGDHREEAAGGVGEAGDRPAAVDDRGAG